MSRRGNREGSIYRKTDGRWAASLSIGYAGGKRLRKEFDGRTRAEVADKLTAALRARQQGLPIVGERQTTGAFLEGWLRDTASPKLRPKTKTRYENIIRLWLVPALGRIPLAKLTPDHVQRMMNDALAAGASPQSVCHHRAVLRTALNVALDRGYVSRNAASRGVNAPRVPEREVRALSATDARALLAAVEGDRLVALFTVAVGRGLRQGEALGLRWGDVDLERGTLAVQRALQRVGQEWLFPEPKTRRSRRTVTLPRPVVASLREHRGRQLQERLRAGAAWQGDRWGDLVFCDEIGGPLSGFHVSRRFRALLALAGLPRMRYHELRHGAASLMAAQGVPARVAMEVLGHAQISTTLNIYTHVSPELQRDAADRMGAALWGDR